MTLVRYDDYLIDGPAVEPLDLDEVKKQLRFTSTSEDTLIDLWISMARQYFEVRTGLQLITATWARTLDAQPSGSIFLPRLPLQSIVSVSSDDGSPETVLDASGYRLVAPAGPFSGPGHVEMLSWPGTRGRIVYKAGFGDAPGDVPELIRGALMMLVSYFHKFRAEAYEGKDIAQVPLGAEIIMRQYRYAGLSTGGPMRTI